MKLLIAACLAIAAFLTTTAHAASVTFKANGTFTNGATLSGFLTIDTSTGLFGGTADLAVSGIPTHFTTFNLQRPWPTISPFMTEFEFQNGQASNNLLTFLFPPDPLVGYGGGQLYGTASNVGYFSNYASKQPDGTIPAESFVQLTSGSLTPVPLPSALWTGAPLLALMAACRFRPRKHPTPT